MIRIVPRYLRFSSGLVGISARDAHPDTIAQLRDLASELTGFGAEQIAVHTPQSLHDRLRTALADAPVQVCDYDAPTPDDAVDIEVGVGNPGVALRAKFSCLDHILPCLTVFSMLCARCWQLTDADALKLRFALYEMGTNWSEHAGFADAPTISVEVTSSVTKLHIEFRDNATPFIPEQAGKTDLTNRYAAGERRGFGVMMLQRISRQTQYDHVDGWNITRLVITRSDVVRASNRRTAMANLTVDVTTRGDSAVVRLAGSVDSTSANQLDTQIATIVDAGVTNVIVNLSGVDFISSAGIGVFLGNVSTLRSRGGDLVFAAVPANIAELFEVINITEFFKFVEHEDTVLS